MLPNFIHIHTLCTQNNTIFSIQPTGKGYNTNTTSISLQNSISTSWNILYIDNHNLHKQPISREMIVLPDGKWLISFPKTIRTSHFSQLSGGFFDTPNHRPVEVEGILINFLKTITPDWLPICFTIFWRSGSDKSTSSPPKKKIS